MSIFIKKDLPEIKEDTFTLGLLKAIQYFEQDVPVWQVMGTLGIGARFTMAMNVKTNVEIGHTSSSYIWDIISTAIHCFENLQWKLYVGTGYIGPARSTAAQSEREVPENVEIVKGELSIKGPVLFAQIDGEWIYSEEEIIIDNYEGMPFGAVALQITGVNEFKLTFPEKMLQYLIDTLERGEEPMETTGMGNYSAVSGWKAYARWMQSYSVPLRKIIHPYQQTLIKVLYERRSHFCFYLFKLAENLREQERELILELLKFYSGVLNPLKSLVEGEIVSYAKIREIYFSEQMTLPTFKLIRNHIRQKYPEE